MNWGSKGRMEELNGSFIFLFLVSFFSHSSFCQTQRSELETFWLHLSLIWRLVWCSGVGLSGADEQLVPADHSLPHVHLIQPDVGFSYKGLLHELASVGHQEHLKSTLEKETDSSSLVLLSFYFLHLQSYKTKINAKMPNNFCNLSLSLCNTALLPGLPTSLLLLWRFGRYKFSHFLCCWPKEQTQK